MDTFIFAEDALLASVWFTVRRVSKLRGGVAICVFRDV